MENQDIAQQSEACLSLKKRLLTSLWEDINPLLSEVLKLSRHPTEEDAVLELSRSELLFVALLQALRSKDTVMSGRLLLEVDNWKVLPRLSFYIGHKLNVEFNCPNNFFSSAAEFANTLQSCGLFRVSDKLIEFLDHLAECMRKEIEAVSLRTQADARQEEGRSIQEESGGSKKTRRRDNRRRKNSKMNQSPQVTQMTHVSSSLSSIPSITSAQQEVAWAATSSLNTSLLEPCFEDHYLYTSEMACYSPESYSPIHSPTQEEVVWPEPSSPVTPLKFSPWDPSEPRLIIVRPKEEVEAASEALWDVLGTKNVSAMIAAIWNGADVQRKYSGATPLHYAAHHGHLKVVKLLLDLGVNLEAVNTIGDRPLHVAARMGRNAVISRLVKAGANLHSIGYSGRTPLQIASNKGLHSTINLLRSLGARH